MKKPALGIVSSAAHLAAVVGALCSFSPAQDRPNGEFSPPLVSISDRATGVGEVDGELWGGGPGYRVRFDTHRVEFTPALGERAKRSYPLTVGLAAVGRGQDVRAVPPGASARSRDGNVVSYARGGFAERYEVRADGVEQSLVFDRLPAGAGDLVVRYRLDTELPLAHASDVQLRFETGGLGGVTISAVVGIDALGRRARGSLHYADGMLDLRLPGDFVDDAALPLVLDPLFGARRIIESSSRPDSDPEIAYDTSNFTYLVVWTRTFSSTDHDLMAQRISDFGSLIGRLLFVRAGSGIDALDPVVANVNRNDAFVVAWREGIQIAARSASAATGSLSGAILAASEGRDPDLGGNATASGSDAILTYSTFSGSRGIRAQRLRTTASTVRTFGGALQVSSVTGDAQPAISQSGGSTGRYLIAWRRVNDRSIRAAVVDSSLRMLDASILVWATPAPQYVPAPSVDGDGSSWVVAWTVQDTFPAWNTDVWCRTVSYDPSSGAAYFPSAATAVERDQFDREYAPAVTWLDESAWVLFADEYRDPDYGVAARSVDPFECYACEARIALQSGPGMAYSPIAVASMKSGNAAWSTNVAFAVWSVNGQIVGQYVYADAGNVQVIGSGCGQGGEALATCVKSSNPSFRMRLRHARRYAPATLLLAPSTTAYQCGSCVLRTIGSTFYYAGATDYHGNATVSLDLPALSAIYGSSFYAQWLVQNGTECWGSDVSSAIRVRVQ